MKFVYFGYDFMIDSVQRLIADGHELVGIFSFECDNVFNFNVKTRALAQKLDIPITLEKPQAEDIVRFLENGAGCFLSGGYMYKIPPIDPEKAYGVNVHPSLLPKGRGIMPTPYIILNAPEAAGFTAHKLTMDMDGGDILRQVPLPLSERETVETYSARIAMAGPDFLSNLFEDLEYCWANAKPQDEESATYFPPPTDHMRLLDWNADVETIDRTARAFGRYGSLAHLENQLYVVYGCDVWEERHDHPPGSIIARLSRELVIAASNGYACLKDFHPVQMDP